MPTYRLTIAYDGTDFAGWQKQEPPDPTLGGGAAPVREHRLEPGLESDKPGRVALRTVQAVVERAVREVVREPVQVKGASRTDSGVHARCQVAVFSCSGDVGRRAGLPVRESEEPAHAETRRCGGEEEGEDSRGQGGWPLARGVDRLLRAVNSRLPDDVQVVRAEVVPFGFDPISDCAGKGYSYTLWSGLHRPLWARRYVHHTWATLDVGAMQRAAGAFVGTHDFAGFAAAGHGRQSTVREIYACSVSEIEESRLWSVERTRGVLAGEASGEMIAEAEAGRLIRIEVSGSGFLYNMVRIIAGTLHEVGRGRIDAAMLPEIIASTDRRRAGPTLPATGLCLEWIRYADGEAP